MDAIRGSLSNIPGTISNLIGHMPMPTTLLNGTLLNRGQVCAPPLSSPPSSLSGDDSSSEKSHAIPASLITEEWQLVLAQNASVDDLENAIARCKDLVINTDECSYERKWLVRHLVELRFRLNEIQDVMADPQQQHLLQESKSVMNVNTSVMVILGHHFVPGRVINANTVAKVRQYCDHCSGVIWSVVQASFVCSDCHFYAHHKCVQNIIRICAHIIASERSNAIEDICPEIGLAAQKYKCAECATPLNTKGTWIEARLCDYTGLYFCPTCHWNDTISIPARVIHNWDFSHRKVSRSSLQELHLIQDRPAINLSERNAKLFVYVQNLSVVKKLRENLHYMKQYLSECRIAIADKLIDTQIGARRRHLIQSPLMYSMADLIAAESGTLVDFLNRSCRAFDRHIRHCDICMGKGYLCEICGNNEVIFPYDDGVVLCNNDEDGVRMQCGGDGDRAVSKEGTRQQYQRCGAVYHRACWIRKNMTCPKCKRLRERRSLLEEKREQEATSTEMTDDNELIKKV